MQLMMAFVVIAVTVSKPQQEKWWYLCREIGVEGSRGEPTVHQLRKNMCVDVCFSMGYLFSMGCLSIYACVCSCAHLCVC
jgi:hypothetical protein